MAFSMRLRTVGEDMVSVTQVITDEVSEGSLRTNVREALTLVDQKVAEAMTLREGCILDGINRCTPGLPSCEGCVHTVRK